MMGKGRTAEEQLTRLAALRGMGAALLQTELVPFLASKVNLIVARAAEIAQEAGAGGLEAPLVQAFWRFMEDADKTDRGCAAKTAIASALYELGCDSEEARRALLAGVRHVQGFLARPNDDASELRGMCALGLVKMRHREVMPILVDLLMDRAPQTRCFAARALAYAGRPEGALVLRLKLLGGDAEESVLAECITAMGQLDGSRSLGFISRYLLDARPGVLSAAAMAIGEMRTPEAMAALAGAWGRIDPPNRSELLLPMALTRRAEGVDFLIRQIEQGDEKLMKGAVEALQIYRHDQDIGRRIEQAQRTRGRLRDSQ